jgi:hypothetical protein
MPADHMRRGWGASAGIEKDPGSLGYARDDTKKKAILYRCPTIGTVLLEDAV